MCGSNDVYILEFFQYVSHHSGIEIETNAILKYMRTIYRCHTCRYKPETIEISLFFLRKYTEMVSAF
jgi:hypothetical protein